MKNVKDTGPVWLQAERWASGLAVALCMRISDLVSSLWKSHSSVMQISPRVCYATASVMYYVISLNLMSTQVKILVSKAFCL